MTSSGRLRAEEEGASSSHTSVTIGDSRPLKEAFGVEGDLGEGNYLYFWLPSPFKKKKHREVGPGRRWQRSAPCSCSLA